MVSTIDPARFRSVLGRLPTGVTVVTGMTDDGPAGLAIGSFTSVSLDPPLVAFCPARTSTSWRRIAPGGVFCANVLGVDQEDTCRAFASRVPSRFTGLDWSTSPLGSPILAGVVAWIDCYIEDVHEAGDHDIVVGRVHDLDGSHDRPPLVFRGGAYGTFREVTSGAGG